MMHQLDVTGRLHRCSVALSDRSAVVVLPITHSPWLVLSRGASTEGNARALELVGPSVVIKGRPSLGFPYAVVCNSDL